MPGALAELDRAPEVMWQMMLLDGLEVYWQDWGRKETWNSRVHHTAKDRCSGVRWELRPCLDCKLIIVLGSSGPSTYTALCMLLSAYKRHLY